MRRPVAALAAALLLAPAPVPAAVYALVIGIDDYAHAKKLKGAVNDARDIAEAVRALDPAEVVVLLDREATREAVMREWRRLAGRAGPGDLLLVTYAGHGGNEPAAFPETEEDGLDENIQLAGFRPTGPEAGERIRDDEIAGLIALSAGAQVVFVADSCHSGTLMRASESPNGYRLNLTGRLRDDPLPPLSAPAVDDFTTGGRNLFIGAVPEDEKVPEIRIGTEIRGALSHAFAAALRGAGDLDRDGILSKGELERYVREAVEKQTDGAQLPRVLPDRHSDLALFPVPKSYQPAPAVPGPFAKPFRDLPPVRLDIQGVPEAERAVLHAAIDGAERARFLDEGLVWDVGKRQLRAGASGDVLLALEAGQAPDQQALVQTAVDKFRVVQALLAATARPGLSLRFDTGNGVYTKDDPVTMRLSSRTAPAPVIFDLSADGTIHLIYPDPAQNDAPTVPQATDLVLTIWPWPPYGADHMVAIETPAPDPGIAAALRHAGTRDVRALWDALHAALGDRQAAVALFPFFTAATR